MYLDDHEWIALALSLVNSSAMRPFAGKDFYFSTDGMRMHIVEMNKDNIERHTKERGVNVEEMVDFFNNTKLRDKFYINPEYLIDALRGFEDQVCIEVRAGETPDKGTVLVITSPFNDRVAYVMGMLPYGEDDDE